MAKLAILSFGEGNFTQGFNVTLQISEEQKAAERVVIAKLPPNPDLPQYYAQWRSLYEQLRKNFRLSAPKAQVTNFSMLDCDRAALQVKTHLNLWLQSESFRPIREAILQQFTLQEEVRIVLQTEDLSLRQLPWSQWDVVDQHLLNAEIALSNSAFEQPQSLHSTSDRIRILAILGNSEGIETEKDRQALERLPDAEITFLVEPSRQQLNDALWESAYDILFFAGHSLSHETGITGTISINLTEMLPIQELRKALQTAVRNGLKLAIFNSCDGLGLAYALADLQIPQTIVMREPVPDYIAQSFLQYFLKAFSSGQSLYLSVRHARERLQGLEDQIPCASWLPVIYQNPTAIPPTWQSFPTPKPSQPSKLKKRSFVNALFVSFAIAATFAGTRTFGFLQTSEAQVFDQMMQRRPDEGADPRLVLITIDDEDLKIQPDRKGSLSDSALVQLLEKLAPQQPRAIGLDIYRDFAIMPNLKQRFDQIQRQVNFIAVCKMRDPTLPAADTVSPPPEVPISHIGFSDFLEDVDGILRQQLVWTTPDVADPCSTPYAFSTQLAFQYLAMEKILPKFPSEQTMQLKDATFTPQMLLNYRSTARIAAEVPLREILQGKINASIVKDRIVIIGVKASGTDSWQTPYGVGGASRMPGMVVQAHMVSQMVNAVLEHRPLLKTLPRLLEIAAIIGIALLSGMIAWRVQSQIYLGIALIAVFIGLYVLGLWLLIQGFWLPILHLSLSWLSSGVCVKLLKSVNHSIASQSRQEE